MKRRNHHPRPKLYQELYERLRGELEELARERDRDRYYARMRAVRFVLRTLLVLLMLAWHVSAFVLLWSGATDESIARAVSGAGMLLCTAALKRRCL